MGGSWRRGAFPGGGGCQRREPSLNASPAAPCPMTSFLGKEGTGRERPPHPASLENLTRAMPGCVVSRCHGNWHLPALRRACAESRHGNQARSDPGRRARREQGRGHPGVQGARSGPGVGSSTEAPSARSRAWHSPAGGMGRQGPAGRGGPENPHRGRGAARCELVTSPSTAQGQPCLVLGLPPCTSCPCSFPPPQKGWRILPGISPRSPNPSVLAAWLGRAWAQGCGFMGCSPSVHSQGSLPKSFMSTFSQAVLPKHRDLLPLGCLAQGTTLHGWTRGRRSHLPPVVLLK